MYKFALLVVPLYFLWKMLRGLYCMHQRKKITDTVAEGQVWVCNYGNPTDRHRLHLVSVRRPWVGYKFDRAEHPRLEGHTYNMHIGFLVDNYVRETAPEPDMHLDPQAWMEHHGVGQCKCKKTTP